MYKAINKFGLPAAVGVAALLIILSIIVYLSNPDAYVIVKNGVETTEGEVSWILASSYILVGLAVIMALVVFPIMSIIDNPKGGMKVLIGIVTLAVIALIGYAIADTDVTTRLANMDDRPTSGDLSFTGAILGTAWIAIILAVLAVVSTEVLKILR